MTQSTTLKTPDPQTVAETAAYLKRLSRDELARWFAELIEESRFALGERLPAGRELA